MPIVAAEVKWYKSKSVSDAGSNGGRMSANESASNVKNNVFPDVSQAERTAGSLKYRKMFVKFANDADLEASNVKMFVENPTPGGDSLTIFAGTQTDVQSGIVTPRLYGCGQLQADVVSGVSAIQVMTEDATLDYFKDGDTIRISDKTTVDALTGNEEYATISGTPSYAGNIATITLAAPLASGYAAANTRVASIFNTASVKALLTSGPTVTSAAGTFNSGGLNPIVLDHIGGVQETFTLTFTSPTTFSCNGDTLGALGSGSTAAPFAPNNPDFSKPYFTIPSAAWGGTYVAGETVVFTTAPAAVPVWYRREVPAGTGSQPNNAAAVAVDFESA